MVDVPKWLNDKFITKCLRAHYVSMPGLMVRHIKVTMAVPPGNYLGRIYRVRADFYYHLRPQDTEMTYLIVKTPPQGPLADTINGDECVKKEVCMYDDVLPCIWEILDGERLTPFNYYSPKKEILVLEDLETEGYSITDRTKRFVQLDYKHSELALQVLAKFHAASVALYKEDRSKLSVPGNELFYREELRNRMQPFVTNVIHLFAEEVKTWPGFEGIADKMNNVAENAWVIMERLVTSKDDALNVLCHGDFWKNNILFKYIDNELVNAKVIDFQFCRYTTPALDLQSFFVSSVNEDVLFNRLEDLISAYLHCLNSTLIRVGCVCQQMSEKDFYKHLKDSDFYGLMVAVFNLPFWVADPIPPQHGDKDLSTTDKKLYKKVFKGKNYKDIMCRILNYYENRGLFNTYVFL